MSQQPMSDDGVPGDFEHPNQDLRRSVIITLYFAFILSTTAVALRLLARKLNGTRLYLDDYLIIIALLFKYGCSTGVAILLFNGLGSHITMIPEKNLTIYLKIGWSNPLVYSSCIAFVKFSVLALYKRLFSTPRMIFAANIVAGFVILWWLSVCVVGILLCLPVNKFWDPSVPGSCLDSAQYYYGQQIPNIFTDAVLLVMPLKFVWALPISKTQRLLLSGVFVTGGLTLIFDIVRLVAMINLTRSGPDVTYNQTPVVVYTCVEATVGIIAACLPNLRPLLKLSRGSFWSQIRSGTGHSKQPLMPAQELSMEESNYDPYFTQTNIYARHSVSIQYSKP
ncbi:integral membrane protein [Aspergillus flavus AF70]|nr:integral membrane protein [Aspergillus flavus AF70]